MSLFFKKQTGQEQVTSDIWSYSLASQTWTEIISPQGFIGRAWFGATIDNRNMIYVFGGQNPIHGDDGMFLSPPFSLCI